MIFNPVSGLGGPQGADKRRRALEAILTTHGVRARWYQTSREDSGFLSLRHATAEGADVILVSGGDGTVMACASAMAGIAVPLGIIPSGTGNIIAASLRIPTSLVHATEIALHGDRVWIDAGASGSGYPFFATSIGVTAAAMRDATPALKARAGMLAYALGGARHALDPPGTFRLLLDGEPLTAEKSDAVLVGNFSRLMRRSRLPQTSLDDGLLEVGVFRIRPFLDWLRQRRPAPRPPRRPPLDWYQARQVVIDCDRPRPMERDGDFVAMASRLEASVVPRSLLVCVPGPVNVPAPGWPLLRWAVRDAGRLLSRRSGSPAAATAGTDSCRWNSVLGPHRRLGNCVDGYDSRC